MELLWTPGRMGPMTTKNRTVRSATNEHLATREGVLTDAWVDVYAELAAGGVGTIITGQFAVDVTQRADEGQPTIDARMGEEHLAVTREKLRRASGEVHRYGAKLVVQLSHSGAKASAQVNGVPPKKPADFERDELENLVKRFIFTAKTCQEGGVDGVQIHMAHGYLLSTFLQVQANERQDEYGGSLENRYRLCGEIIRGVREVCGPEFAILVKADGRGCGDLRGLLELCQRDGVDCVEVSDLDCSQHPGEKQAFYLDTVKEAKAGLSIPVSLVGGIFSMEEAEKVLDAGIEYVSFGRPLIYEPDFIARLERGEVTQSGCLACYGCYKVYRQRPVRCVRHTAPIPHLAEIFGPYEK